MQKFVTIYLDSNFYLGDRWIAASNADKHGFVEEHLKAELADGWHIVSVSVLRGARNSASASGWLAVVLEK